MDGIKDFSTALFYYFGFLCRFVRQACNVNGFKPDHRPFPPVGTGSRA